MELYWGVGSAEDVYGIEQLILWKNIAPNFNCTLAIDNSELPKLPEGIQMFSGKLANAITNGRKQFNESDAYVAGSPAMMPEISKILMEQGIASEDIHIDSFGL